MPCARPLCGANLSLSQAWWLPPDSAVRGEHVFEGSSSAQHQRAETKIIDVDAVGFGAPDRGFEKPLQAPAGGRGSRPEDGRIVGKGGHNQGWLGATGQRV